MPKVIGLVWPSRLVALYMSGWVNPSWYTWSETNETASLQKGNNGFHSITLFQCKLVNIYGCWYPEWDTWVLEEVLYNVKICDLHCANIYGGFHINFHFPQINYNRAQIIYRTV